MQGERTTSSGKIKHEDKRYEGIYARRRKDGTLKFRAKVPRLGGGQSDVSLDPADTWEKARKAKVREESKDKHERTINSKESLQSFGSKVLARKTGNTKKKHESNFRKWVTPILHRPLSEITRREVQELVIDPMVTAGLSPLTIHNVRRTLNIVFKEATKSPALRHDNPVSDLALPKKEAKFKHAGLTAIQRDLCRTFKSRASKRYEHCVAALIDLGLRDGEALGLRPCDVKGLDWSGTQSAEELQRLQRAGELQVEIWMARDEGTNELTPELKTSNSQRKLTIPLTLVPHLLAARRQMIEQYSVIPIDLDQRPLFGHINAAGLQGYVSRMGAKLGITSPDKPLVRLTPHSFRQNWVSNLIRLSVRIPGLDIITIARMAGHTVETLKRDYAKDFEELENNLGGALAAEALVAEAAAVEAI